MDTLQNCNNFLSHSARIRSNHSSHMTPQHPISTRLREARVAKNISVNELQAKARIREHLIEAIEDGRFDELPAVYMRSFLRRYAEHVGVPSKEIDDLIAQNLDGSNATSSRNSSKPFSLISSLATSSSYGTSSLPRTSLDKTNSRRRILIILVSVFGVTCLMGIYLLLRGPADSTGSSDRQSILRSVDSLIAPSEPAGKLMNYFGVAPQDSISLEAVCTDTVWINITIDKKFSDIIMLNPGQQRTWSAMDNFALSVRNAGGVTFKRNGLELPRIGKIGETVRSIRITRTEFITSASPWRSQRDTVKTKPSTAPSSIKPTTPVTVPGKTVAPYSPATNQSYRNQTPQTTYGGNRTDKAPATPQKQPSLQSKPIASPIRQAQPAPTQNSAPANPEKKISSPSTASKVATRSTSMPNPPPATLAAPRAGVVSTPPVTRSIPAPRIKPSTSTPARAPLPPKRVQKSAAAVERERQLRLERIRREANKRDLTPVIIR